MCVALCVTLSLSVPPPPPPPLSLLHTHTTGFYGGLAGLIPKKDLDLLPGQVAEDVYAVGQLIRVQVRGGLKPTRVQGGLEFRVWKGGCHF